jgi:hypothetical protein
VHYWRQDPHPPDVLDPRVRCGRRDLHVRWGGGGWDPHVEGAGGTHLTGGVEGAGGTHLTGGVEGAGGTHLTGGVGGTHM